MASVMLAGLKNRSSSGRAARGSRGGPPLVRERVVVRRVGALGRLLRQHSRIQSPIMFLRNRIVPKTPPSFVKFAAATAEPTRGSDRSTPTRDQVPDET